MDAGVIGGTHWGVEIVKGLIGLVLGFVGGVAMEKYKARRSRNTLVAGYLEGLATALEGMADGLEERKIPYGDGQTVFRMFLASKNVISGYIEKNELERIRELVEYGDRFYAMIRAGENSPVLDESINMARRVAGILKARAAELKLK